LDAGWIDPTFAEPSNKKQPEYLLWLAVVARAVFDYVIILEQRENRSGVKKSEPYLYTATWFLFSNDIEPHNLLWVSYNLFGSDGFAERVRKRAKSFETESLRAKAKKIIAAHNLGASHR
jgi:hypothetical protein